MELQGGDTIRNVWWGIGIEGLCGCAARFPALLMTRAKFDTLLMAFAAGTVFQVIYVCFLLMVLSVKMKK